MKKNNLHYLWYLVLVVVLLVISNWLGRFDIAAFAAIFVAVVLFIVSIYIFKNPFLGAILLIYALPFERIPTFDVGLITIKINQGIAGLMIIGWLLQFIFNKDHLKLQSYPIGWFLVLFLLDGLVSAATSMDTSRSYAVLVFTIFMAFTSFVFVQLLNTPKKSIILIRSLFIITAIVSLFAIYQFVADLAGLPITLTGLKDIYTKVVFGFPRIHAFSMEPLFFGNFLFMPLSLALSFYIFLPPEKRIFKHLGALILLIALCMVLGLSRGVYIAVVVLVLSYLVFATKSVIKIKNISSTIIVAILVLTGVYTFLSYSSPDAVERFVSQATVQDFSSGESVQKRLSDYEKAYIYWQEKPIIGIGPGNYGPRYYDYPSHEDVSDWEVANNQYLEILSEWGIIGLVLFLLMIILIFVRSFFVYKYTQDQYLKAALFGSTTALLAILVQYNFFSTIYIMHIWIYIGLVIAIQNIAKKSYAEV